MNLSRQGQLLICSKECMFVNSQPLIKFRLNCVKNFQNRAKQRIYNLRYDINIQTLFTDLSELLLLLSLHQLGVCASITRYQPWRSFPLVKTWLLDSVI